MVLGSLDTVALDAVATTIIGLDPLSVLTTKYAHERGLGIGNIENIEVVGATTGDVTVSDFKLPASYSGAIVGNVPTFLSRFLLNQMTIRPIVIKRLCTGCFECQGMDCNCSLVWKKI